LFTFLERIVGERIDTCAEPQDGRISILLPVLNESERIEACLAGVMRQTEEVGEILVIDSGSTDGTRSCVERYARQDPRIRLIDGSPVDARWTGKAWALNFGLQRSAGDCHWILCLDADVQLSPLLARSLLAHAHRTHVTSFSVATRQRLSGIIDAIIHPALLTTLVYRYGVPGRATRNLHMVQANGQCFLSRRETLIRTEAFLRARASLCEDITAARRLAECGEQVGFYEAGTLIKAAMYRNWRETWRNWPRSLPMRDQYFGWREAAGLLGVLLLQAMPLPLFLYGAIAGAPGALVGTSAVLLLVRFGVLYGTARAYVERPWSYWLSPLSDLPAALRLIQSALRRRHTWRGRSYVRGKGGAFEPVQGKS
jgi:dolichol-phosphate mannosyltransferase